jgi:hypothetical protein
MRGYIVKEQENVKIRLLFVCNRNFCLHRASCFYGGENRSASKHETATRRLKSLKCKFSILISSAGLYFGTRRNTFTLSKKLYLKAPVD